MHKENHLHTSIYNLSITIIMDNLTESQKVMDYINFYQCSKSVK